jgi:hypothetical protein
MVLEAEGKRVALILQSQGEAQKLRIMSVGAASLDSKALSVLQMETMKVVGQGQSSKIFFPMEVTRLMEGISQYVGTASNVPDRPVSTMKDMEKAFGNVDDILGSIPNEAEIKDRLSKADKIATAELADSVTISTIPKG